jgi:protein-S-isoprenylcysteine O-methyltransferase Ste14
MIWIIFSLIFWLILTVYWVIRSKNRGIFNEIVGTIKLIMSGVILYVSLLFDTQFLSYTPTLIVQILSLVTLALGLIFCIISRECLASNWSAKIVIQDKHTLVQQGPYKIVRHPIYFGVLVMMLGTSMLIGFLIGFVWVLFCFWGLFLKARKEEELLLKKFGEKYLHYQKMTKMIIPFML